MTDGASGTPAPPARVEFEHVEALAHYRLTDNGWRLDASRLRIGSGANVQTLDGLAVAAASAMRCAPTASTPVR
nr:hypothetical protein [Lysobacter enzymogenes]